MTFFITVIILIGYFFIGSFMAAVAYLISIKDRSDNDLFIIIMIWPIILFFILIVGFIELLKIPAVKFSKRLSYKIMRHTRIALTKLIEVYTELKRNA